MPKLPLGSSITVSEALDILEQVRREHVPDSRAGVFNLTLEPGDGALVLKGSSTHPAAVADVLARLEARGAGVADGTVLLPDPALGLARHAIATAAVAPVYLEPALPAAQISQLVLGMRVDVLCREGYWFRIRAEDGYIGWVHAGYVTLGEEEWAFGWERGSTGDSVVSLGAELVDDDGGILARLPWGARLTRHSGAYHTADGRRGSIAGGEVVDVDRIADRFPPRGESIARTARRWLGSPYLWGGVTPGGVDCSGLTQAVMWMHGVALPRDSDLQERVGADVSFEAGFDDVRAGDLLYFAEPGARVSHVAISLGGSQIIHSALTNGGVALDDLAGDAPFERRLRDMLVRVRRMLAD